MDKTWEDTYSNESMTLNDYSQLDHVAAITDDGILTCKIKLWVDTEHSNSYASTRISADQMRQLAAMLVDRADFVEQLVASHRKESAA